MPEINYFWDEIEDNVIEEYDENGSTTASYMTEPTLYGAVLSQNRSGEKRHFQFDGQGNTTELTNDSGTVTDSRRYTAFGEITASSGSTVLTRGFGGRWGYHSGASSTPFSIRHRLLSALLARWFTEDPVHALGFTHPYVYASNSPTRLVDPSGLSPFLCLFQQSVVPASVVNDAAVHCILRCLDDVRAWEDAHDTTIRVYLPGTDDYRRCRPRFRCVATAALPCTGTLDITATPASRIDLIDVTLPCYLSPLSLIIMHEMAHVRQQCLGLGPIDSCMTCVARESEAHAANCHAITPFDSTIAGGIPYEGDAYLKCLACGVSISCETHCRTSDLPEWLEVLDMRPEGCSLTTLGVRGIR